MDLKILNRDGNWISGLYQGKFFQAKIYDEPSMYGINQGRVSKLAICSGPEWEFGNIIYNYDRGIDLHHPIGLELAALLETWQPPSEEAPHGPIESKIVVRLTDKDGRGDIVVERLDLTGPYKLWVEIVDIPGGVWEDLGVYKSLTEAMGSVAAILEVNCEQDFYCT